MKKMMLRDAGVQNHVSKLSGATPQGCCEQTCGQLCAMVCGYEVDLWCSFSVGVTGSWSIGWAA